MGIFKSKEEKQAKHDAKIQAFLDARGLENLSKASFGQVERVTSDLAGNGLIKAGMAFSFANAADQAKVSYLSALVEQNWILIKQNDDILRELVKLNQSKLEE
ncbi:hypothetical protein [Schleiferilactobacillus harbinensis]|uniref:hypothetical protein n=1 Tax=Schleiferilactobacillus harbinensis TaxID=304207 RepID=UPI0039EAD65C